jgi:nucleotide-binding universal stress UspA family protein
MLTARRPEKPTTQTLERARGRPVMLATLGVPFEGPAAALAVDTAVECGQALVVVNVVELLLAPASVVLGYGDLDDDPDDAAALYAPARLAHDLGVEVERLRVQSPRPLAALLEVVAERRPGLLVFGPDRTRLGRRAYRKAAKAVRERAACLVWLPD